MKRFSAISFLVIYLLTATECNQFLKLPVLIEHFTEHKKINSRISFLDFLYLHYTGHDLNDNDDARDRQLPFKSPNNYSSGIALTIPTQPPAVTLNITSNTIKKPVTYQRLNFKSTFFSSIWQPPKFC